MESAIIEWKDLIKTFETPEGKVKVVKWAKGRSPWGSPIVAELQESGIDRSILVSLPDQGNRLLAVLDGNQWEIWITPKGEIHVVRPRPTKAEPIPDEYLFLTRK